MAFSNEVVRATLIGMWLAGGIALIAFAFAGPDLVDTRTRNFAMMAGLSLGCGLSAALILDFKGRAFAARALSISTLSTTVVVIVLLTGGLTGSVAVPTLISVPCICYCLASVRTGLIVGAATPLVVLLAEAVFGLAGVTLPDFTSQSSEAFNRIMPSAASYLVVLFCMGGLVRANTVLQRRLKEEHEKLELLSRVDPLTGIANRRAFDIELDLQMALSQASGASTGLILMDFDGFKPINDRYGHPVGDEVLKIVAQRLNIFRSWWPGSVAMNLA